MEYLFPIQQAIFIAIGLIGIRAIEAFPVIVQPIIVPIGGGGIIAILHFPIIRQPITVIIPTAIIGIIAAFGLAA